MHIVFDSDLNRETLPGGPCERTHSMRANQLLDSPMMEMPKPLCKAFILWGERNGERIELLRVSENRRRAYHLAVSRPLDRLILVPLSAWGGGERIPVISFDFN